MPSPDISFSIVALGPITQGPENSQKRVFTASKSELDNVLQEIRPALSVSLPEKLCRAGFIDLEFTQMKDFHPDGIIDNNPRLKGLLNAEVYIRDALKRGTGDEEVFNYLKNLPDLPFELEKPVARSDNKPKSTAVDDIMQMVAMPGQGSTTSANSSSWLSKIEEILEETLGFIFSDDGFRQLESIWRGIDFFLKQDKSNGKTRLQIAATSKETLADDLTALLPVLLENIPRAILIDVPFDSSAFSIALLEKIAGLAGTIMAPAIVWVDEKFFNLSSWNDLDKLPYLPNHLEGPAFAKWRRLKSLPSADYMAVTCNRFLTRFQYGDQNKPRSVNFVENKHLWISPVWALASMLSKRVAQSGFPTRFVEWQTDKIEDLALRTAENGRQLATETTFQEDRIPQFSKAGIIPLIAPLEKDYAFTTVDTTIGRESLSYMLLKSWVVGLLLWCRDNYNDSFTPEKVRNNIEKAFGDFCGKNGLPSPEDLDISFSEPESSGSPEVIVNFTPSREILPSRKSIRLQFPW